jgi:hypothetical protein
VGPKPEARRGDDQRVQSQEYARYLPTERRTSDLTGLLGGVGEDAAGPETLEGPNAGKTEVDVVDSVVVEKGQEHGL